MKKYRLRLVVEESEEAEDSDWTEYTEILLTDPTYGSEIDALADARVAEKVLRVLNPV